jgi:hypothetical protein
MGNRNTKDPRVAFPNHRERGCTPYRYTYEDIARCAGVSVRTVRGAASRRGDKAPSLDPRSLESVVAFVERRRSKDKTMIFQLMTDNHTLFARAPSAAKAREVASSETENGSWKDPQWASCKPVDADGKPEVIGCFDDDKYAL